MIREDLLEFTYYLKRLSKFMQESYGIDEQVKTFWAQLKQVDDYYNTFFEELDVFNHTYSIGNEEEMLDKIGAIFGCFRKFTIPVIDGNGLITGYEEVNLNNSDFLQYIKTQIIKQNFDGKRETLQKIYSTYVDGKIIKGLTDLEFIYATVDGSPATCTIYWATENPSPNLLILFENGYLTIESLGIEYRRIQTNINNLAYYYLDPETPKSSNYYAYLEYALTTSQPSDWSSNYEDYYTVIASLNSNPTWDDTNDYYKKVGDDYIFIECKPVCWDTDYNTFYILMPMKNTSSTWSANTYYKETDLGGLYS